LANTLPRVTDNATCHIKDLTRDNFFLLKNSKKKLKKLKNPEADTWQGS